MYISYKARDTQECSGAVPIVCELLQDTCLLYWFLFAVWRASRETLPSRYVAFYI